jgi:ABC-2 type transport system ATP-binding protein
VTGPILATERLTKRYDRARGVEDVTFTVERGEVFGFLGPNGAGKSTTIRTLLDFIRPTSGRASVFGLDSRADAIEIHRRVGYLPGDFAAYELMTGREYLEYFAALRGVRDPSPIDDLASRLSADLTARIDTLSHGNKQKLGLLQAFMHRPELLILDEPTQGLDPIVQRTFHAMVAEARDGGATVFLSSHVLPEVERICDRVGIIRDGRLIDVEEVGAMKARSVRTLELHFTQPVPASVFEGLPGVRDLEVHGDVVRCTVSGSVDAIVKAAARFEVLDIESHEPSLEDVFLAFYTGDGERTAPVGDGAP